MFIRTEMDNNAVNTTQPFYKSKYGLIWKFLRSIITLP